MRQLVLASLLVLLFAFPGRPALAQGCGLPTAGGSVTVSMTYTLTADCTMTDTLAFGSASDGASKITITINGGGHTITGTTNACGADPIGKRTFIVEANVEFNLNNVTIKGGGRRGGSAIDLRKSAHSATISNVTFLQTYCTALRFDSDVGPDITHSLSNLLFEGVSGTYNSPTYGIPTAIHTIGPVSLNINNITLREISTGNAAIGANDTYRDVTRSTGTITFNGCLMVDGVFPRVYYGDIADNSEGACSGTVGNGGSSAMEYPQASDSGCGLPSGGFVYGRHVFNLRSDCALTDRLLVPYESDVVVNGNGYTIDASGSRSDAFAVAGGFSLNNVVLTGVNRYPILTYLDKNMRISNSIFRDNAGPLIFQDSIVTLEDVLVERHSHDRFSSGVMVHLSAQVTIRNSVFRDNTGGQGAIWVTGPNSIGVDPSVLLEDCITFENNSPHDIADTSSLLMDNRSRPCPPDKKFLVPSRPAPDAAPPEDRPLAQPAPRPPGGLCDGKPEAVQMGAVACVFRHTRELAVYGIDAQSRGFFMGAATLAQINAVGAGMVAASPDGRAAIFADENGDVIVSVGPDHEGKVLHLRLERGIHGRAINLRTTFGGPPGLGFTATVAVPVPPRTNALTGCMVRTNYMVNFRDAPNGGLLSFVDIWGIPNDGMLPYDVTLTALERTSDWFKVDYHGTQGWISAHYVEPKGNCG